MSIRELLKGGRCLESTLGGSQHGLPTISEGSSKGSKACLAILGPQVGFCGLAAEFYTTWEVTLQVERTLHWQWGPHAPAKMFPRCELPPMGASKTQRLDIYAMLKMHPPHHCCLGSSKNTIRAKLTALSSSWLICTPVAPHHSPACKRGLHGHYLSSGTMLPTGLLVFAVQCISCELTLRSLLLRQEHIHICGIWGPVIGWYPTLQVGSLMRLPAASDWQDIICHKLAQWSG